MCRLHEKTLQPADGGPSNLPFYPPGSIIHLRQLAKTTSPDDPQPYWDAVWCSAEDIISEGLLVSSQMFAHHSIPIVTGALAAATENAPGGEGQV